MGTKRSNKALLDVIPPRICVTFRRASFWSRSKNSKILFWELQAENTVNTGPGSHDNFPENVQNHEQLSKRDSYPTSRAENQAIWISKLLQTQWDHWGLPKLQYKMQNRRKIQWTKPTQLSTKFGHQPWEEQESKKARKTRRSALPHSKNVWPCDNRGPWTLRG